MWKQSKHFKAGFLIFVLFFMPAAFIYLQAKHPSLLATIKGPFLDASLPFQRSLTELLGAVFDFIYKYKNSLNNHEELLDLRGQVKKLNGLQIALTEVELENERLRALIHSFYHVEKNRILSAQVIGRTAAPLSYLIQLDKGRQQGIMQGDAVVNAQGAIGQVFLTARNSSMVLLICDSTSAVDVIVQRTRARGILRGFSGSQTHLLRVGDFDRLDDIAEGDIIITSGIGARFPVGIPIGQIVALRRPADGLYIEADIKPFVSFRSVEQVLVLTHGGPKSPWRRQDAFMHYLDQCLGIPKKAD